MHAVQQNDGKGRKMQEKNIVLLSVKSYIAEIDET